MTTSFILNYSKKIIGVSRFFWFHKKIEYVTTDTQLKELKQKAQKVDSTSLGDKVYFNTWMYQEANKQSLLFDRKMSYNGSTPYGSSYSMMSEEEGMENSGNQLLDPQMVVYEPKCLQHKLKCNAKFL